jgi:hypothetical protein
MLHKAKLIMIAICLIPFLVHAEDLEYIELQSRITMMHISYLLNKDFTVEKVSEIEIKALTDSSIKRLKKRHFSHSTSIEKFEVIEAYTKKADGSRIEVPKDNYQVTVNKGHGEDKAILSDRTKVTIVFPGLEKNDSVYMKTKTIVTEPMFPGHFADSYYFWNQFAYDDVKISFDLPEDLAFKKQVRNMAETIKTENGRKLIELTYKSVKPVKNKREDYSVWDENDEAGYALSTFMDYETLAKLYGKRALPKAQPTDRVKKLAADIIGNEKDKKEQARLIYDWVTTNISYLGNCIGVGAVVPHDTDFILDNRAGDCKDHATLLGALYNSVGINSTQGLINSGTSYSLPEITVIDSVNHVINYIPEWDMFVDSTNSSLPFGLLDFSLSDKPVILVENYKPGQRTPASQVGDNHQVIKSTMKIHSDGSVTGDIHVHAKGHPAVDLRRAWRHATQEQEDKWLKDVFSSQNQIGTATMTKDDPDPLLPEFKYSLEFNRPEYIRPEGVDGFYIQPLVATPLSIHSFLGYLREEIEGYSIACNNGRSIEQLSYEFPKEMKILAKPDNFEINENHIHFKATYELEGNKLTVYREIDDQTPGNVCSAELINLQRQTLIKIVKNMQIKVIYQH